MKAPKAFSRSQPCLPAPSSPSSASRDSEGWSQGEQEEGREFHLCQPRAARCSRCDPALLAPLAGQPHVPRMCLEGVWSPLGCHTAAEIWFYFWRLLSHCCSFLVPIPCSSSSCAPHLVVPFISSLLKWLSCLTRPFPGCLLSFSPIPARLPWTCDLLLPPQYRSCPPSWGRHQQRLRLCFLLSYSQGCCAEGDLPSGICYFIRINSQVGLGCYFPFVLREVGVAAF